MIHSKKRQQGFSLVEMAIVLVILGLLIGSGFSTLGAYLDNAKQSHTLGSLENTKKAMLNYVKVNYYMPCPDTNDDGNEDRVSGLACTSSIGTVPFNSIGLGAAIASDDFGNVFAYGIDTGVTSAASMANKDLSASYFSNAVNTNGDFPAFRLETPPTSTNPDVATSYTVCKKSATVCDATPSNVEVNSIPAIIVAFNENGGATALSGCNAETGSEAENCDNDLFVWKKFFSSGAYDDQLVTISGYEIKEQVLDLLSEISLNINQSEYAGYDVIIKGDVDSANATNLGTSSDEAFYIDTTDGNPATGGNLDAQVTLKDGADKLYVTNDILAGGNADMGAGDDELFVGGNISGGGSASLGDGQDIFVIEGSVLYRGDLDLGKGNDTGTVKGSIGGTLTGNTGDDNVTINGDVTGTVNLEADNDTLYLLGDLVGGDIDGGTGDDTLYLSATEGELNALITAEGGSVSNFETIVYGYVP